MKSLRYILPVLTVAIIISVTLSSCFIDFTEFLDVQPTTQEATKPKPKPIEPSDTGYNYNALQEPALKELYGLIHTNAKNKIPEVEFEVSEKLSEEQITLAVNAYVFDHPEVFWLDTSLKYSTDDDSTELCVLYTMEREELESAKSKFNAEINKIVSNAPQNASAYELEMYVHDYIIDNCEYDEEAAESKERIAHEGTAYGAIVEKKAVCSGYAMAFQLLCKKLGVDCVSVLGQGDNEYHQWNCVKLDDSWYQVDVTWDDDDENGDLCRYDYFNLTDSQMYIDHTVGAYYAEVEDLYEEVYNYYIPECTSETYNYYNYSCLTITDIYNSDDIVEYIAKSAQDSKKYAEFLIDENLDYSDTVYTLTYDGYLYEWIEKANQLNDYSPQLEPGCKVYNKEEKNAVTIELTYI